MNQDELDAIRKRANAATPGPWVWSRDYELSDRTKHWCLINPDDHTRTINSDLVLMAHWVRNLDGIPLEGTPDFQFIAHAREDVPALLAEVKHLRTVLQAVYDKLEGMRYMEAAYIIAAALAETGGQERTICHTCLGSGVDTENWTAIEYKSCKDCDGTGYEGGQ